MKVLHTVESYYPQKNGMSEVVRHISENLVKLGHEVYVATSYNEYRKELIYSGVEIIEFKIYGNAVNGIKGEIEEYKNYLLNNDFDIIVNFAAQQWATDICFEILNKIQAKKIIVPTGFSALYDFKYNYYYEQIPKYLNQYDSVIFTSKYYRDFEYSIKNGLNKFCIIPNGASKTEFLKKYNFNLRKYLKLNSNQKIILHVGSYTEIKGHNECLKIFNKVNDKNTHIVFLGENFNKDLGIKFSSKVNWFKYFSYNRIFKPWFWLNFVQFIILFINNKINKIHLLNLDRDSLIQSYKDANVFLFPSNLECSPVVLFEAMASGTPILVSDVGNSREIISNSNAGKLLPSQILKNGYTKIDVLESSRILNRLLTANNILEILSINGKKYWLDNFTWEDISTKYEKLYLSLLK